MVYGHQVLYYMKAHSIKNCKLALLQYLLLKFHILFHTTRSKDLFHLFHLKVLILIVWTKKNGLKIVFFDPRAYMYYGIYMRQGCWNTRFLAAIRKQMSGLSRLFVRILTPGKSVRTLFSDTLQTIHVRICDSNEYPSTFMIHMSDNVLVGCGGILNEMNNYLFLQDTTHKDL